MAINYKILGQSNPAATTNTDVYTVPSLASAICSTLSVCNTTANSATFRVAFRAGGAAIATKHYICYDTAVAGNDTVFISIGSTLSATDVVTVYASSANLSFTLFGSEMV